MDVEITRCLNSDPARVNAVLVGPKRGGRATLNESLGAAGNKRPRTVDSGTPYNRLQPVEVMTMMMNNWRTKHMTDVMLRGKPPSLNRATLS
ncbi:jg23506 [Pararge aegeria aegeria]|uniref:Jg23506 protein n=1 Tax=Pararge aegeria aegeria TaxID=348720 RepID=A0A8S4QV72_9NEOP|nr:jg23506 [Pararge aegeria aegeria]